jgi:hypothetical protein
MQGLGKMRGYRDHLGINPPKTRENTDPDMLQLPMVSILMMWEIRTLITRRRHGQSRTVTLDLVRLSLIGVGCISELRPSNGVSDIRLCSRKVGIALHSVGPGWKYWHCIDGICNLDIEIFLKVEVLLFTFTRSIALDNVPSTQIHRIPLRQRNRLRRLDATLTTLAIRYLLDKEIVDRELV